MRIVKRMISAVLCLALVLSGSALAGEAKENIGKIGVNNLFSLEAKLPEGYKLQVVNVKNTGRVTGDEVAQLYIRRVSPSGTVHPLRRLIGFERLHDIAPGESRKAEFSVNSCDLEIYMEPEGRKIVEPGKYLVYAGGSCLDERVSAEIEL